MTKNSATIDQLKKSLAEVQGEIQGTAANDGTTAGTDMDDGSVFVGVTRDGEKIFAMSMDLGFTATFNDAAKAVERLNEKKALGQDDWQIPDLETLKTLQRNQKQGSLKGTFNTTNKGSDSDCPDWYWSSTEGRNGPSYVRSVRFSDGGEGWVRKGNARLSVRPVRLLAAPGL